MLCSSQDSEGDELIYWLPPGTVLIFTGVAGSIAAGLRMQASDPADPFRNMPPEQLMENYGAIVHAHRDNGRETNFAFVALVYLVASLLAVAELSIQSSGRLVAIRPFLWTLDKAVVLLVVVGTIAFVHGTGGHFLVSLRQFVNASVTRARARAVLFLSKGGVR